MINQFQITHPNIVQTYEIITINHKVFIALEWAGRGDLLAYVRLKGKLDDTIDEFGLYHE